MNINGCARAICLYLIHIIMSILILISYSLFEFRFNTLFVNWKAMAQRHLRFVFVNHRICCVPFSLCITNCSNIQNFVLKIDQKKKRTTRKDAAGIVYGGEKTFLACQNIRNRLAFAVVFDTAHFAQNIVNDFSPISINGKLSSPFVEALSYRRSATLSTTHNALSFMQNIKRHTIKSHVSLHIPIDEHGTRTERYRKRESGRKRERWTMEKAPL